MSKKQQKNAVKASLNAVKNPNLQTDLAEITATGRVLSDHPSNFITPAKMKSIFEEAENGDITAQHELFMDIEERDSAIFANIQTRKRAALGVDWYIRAPRNATPAEEKLVEEVDKLFYQIGNLEDLIMDCMDAVGHGFSALEIEWAFNGKLWYPNTFTHRPQSWFKWDKVDNLLLKTPKNTGEPLREFGWVVHTHKSRSTQAARNNLFRTLAWLYMFKHYSVHDFAEFLELYGMPIRIGKYGAGATKDEKNTLKRALAEIGHNAAGIMPESMSIELHNAANGVAAGNNPFLQMIDWCEKSIARLILGQTLTSGADGKTSTNALGNVHNEVRRDLLVSDVKQLGQTFTQQIILPYLLINFPSIDPTRIPTFEFDTKEPADLASFADSLPKLVDIGLPIPVAWARDKLGIPEVQENEAVLGRITQATPTQAVKMSASLAEGWNGCPCCCQHTHNGKPHALSAQTQKNEQDVLDEAINEALSIPDFNAQLDPMLKKVVGILSACSSFEEASDMLADKYPALSVSAHQDYLTKALFLADLLGVSNAERT
ncbi:hypothetical protein A6046_05220 [[Haemophilus] ducreyi]|uniref:DUF935 domain-containing protein n=1 Tax=Haemophilus ducreyi (strain 35000HP / ATCC 700724) TaxID=233412 RepID=Q7VNK0_HAEDU|nr:DUF935 domain-containing protein [[Haemophilus] ducreyi]AAP95459.1 hypothetical protein HD_0514 [[Haemophilus] ducreyi 35000HP]AKO36324.1 Mu bacteriophage protein gp29 [[Haemophilus] ducreyi]AKO37773.1 Mu bacteriophage protein gp29 [[Haemophilus] ducreyi]AKO39331.1 Mu bacteriophage protein gp29 [[Haemophilus] ducreyi]AKO40822.1 Mu bacteriophage protein gp29 [[Haemophilus] ducreyi]